MNNLLFDEDLNQPLKHPVEKIPNKYNDYLFQSKMRNLKLKEINDDRIGKKNNSSRNNNKRELEEGFSVYFNGANSDLSPLDHSKNKTGHRRDNRSSAIAPRKSKTSEDRRKWGSASKFGFLTDRGDRMFVRANNYYSDDFEESIEIDYFGEEERESIEEELEELGLSVGEELTMKDVRCLRESLVAMRTIARDEEDEDQEGQDDEEEEEIGIGEGGERLREIIDRVLKMSEEQQRKLLKSLEKLETVFEKEEEENRSVKISIKIEENWGHESRVGLTEVEFWDEEKRPIPIDRIACNNNNNNTNSNNNNNNQLGNLSNQKKDTGKEKNMWSTEANLSDRNRPLIIDFYLAAQSITDVKFVAIWNFNKSIDTLSIGVKKVSVWVEGKQVLRTTFVEKSLGNVAFNPATIIDLSERFEGEGKNTSEENGVEDLSSGDECLMERFEMARGRVSEETERKMSAKYGRRSERRDELKELVEEFEGKEKEKLWSSLSFFNKSHAGRLSLDHTGDILDQYIDSMRSARGDQGSVASESFVIPELPRGTHLRINILSTWGDRHYVGLTGIEMFSSGGDPVPVTAINADPPDINVLPGYGNDPRVVANLVDGVNRTRDDTHMWLAPFTAGRDHVVSIEFSEPVELALLRVWNYSKSRIHSSRGARDVEICLDRVPIFRGEISRQAAVAGQGEVILFTADDAILDRIGQNDREFAGAVGATQDDLELIDSIINRPPTAKETSAAPVVPRPFTCSRPAAAALSRDPGTTRAIIRLQLAETWGDRFYIGLTGLQLLDEARQPLSTTIECAANEPDKILDGDNLTDDEDHMWLAQFSPPDQDQTVTVSVDLPTGTRIGFIRFWNYNKSLEDSYRGVKVLHMWINDKRISPDEGYFLRRAPGHTQYDFMQEINIRDYSNVSDDLTNYQHLPCGFVYQFNIFSAWNDLYYVGLNGIEFYDHLGHSLSVGSQQVYAFPDSVNSLILKNQRNHSNLDVRTPDKLVDGVNNTYDPKHMWLAPILPGCLNKIFFVFNRPVAISMIKIWNYSKSPARGVKDFSILVDDLLIHNGILPAATSATVSRGILPNMNETISPTNLHKTVLFDKKNPILLASEKFHIVEHGIASNGQDVILINNNDINAKQCANQKYRPTTSVKHRPQIK